VLALIGHYRFKVDSAPSILMGVALAMSSTAVVMPVLAEKRRLNKMAGRVAFSVLLLARFDGCANAFLCFQC